MTSNKYDIMKKITLLTLSIAAAAMMTAGCCNKIDTDMQKYISDETVRLTAEQIMAACPSADTDLISRGVAQAAALWTGEDGTKEDFRDFAVTNFMPDAGAKKVLFDKLSAAFETLWGSSAQVSARLQMPLHLAGDELTDIDYILGAYSPFAHLSDDLFANKTAFITILNFPNFTLAEKNALGKKWTREEWAYARMGDIFTSRIPAGYNNEKNIACADAENYIASYNIMMGHLLDENGKRLFPEDMVLLSHWNLRDELKSNYTDAPNAHAKQEMIYKVMEHIVNQTIPADVINCGRYDWAPYTNKTYENGKEVSLKAEGSERFRRLLEVFKAERKIDRYSPQLSTAIDRNFEGSMEVAVKDIEKMFIELVSSPEVKEVAKMIETRLGRELRPYDIWYDGFKGRSAIPEDRLSEITRKKYPNAAAFAKDMPRMLRYLGFPAHDAKYISDKIVVESARGSGHAMGAQGRWEPARLRTRIGAGGMDYKGYNIAVHEFGHNVEQTLDLYDIDHYLLNGVPNTAFTEALAFVFQKRDLFLLGYDYKVDDNTTLDIFWGAYEIMGVALVDMYVWQWMYAHPDIDAAMLRDAVVAIAKDVWNTYYEPVLGTHDSPLLAIYSHMIDVPLYLANYPFGHIIEFQLESHFAGCRNLNEFASEIRRIYTLGRLTPDEWMKQAVGSEVSTRPLIEAVRVILSKSQKQQ